jgi:hypothetical protein
LLDKRSDFAVKICTKSCDPRLSQDQFEEHSNSNMSEIRKMIVEVEYMHVGVEVLDVNQNKIRGRRG